MPTGEASTDGTKTSTAESALETALAYSGSRADSRASRKAERAGASVTKQTGRIRGTGQSSRMAPITVAAERHPIFCTSTDVDLPAATRALVHRSSLIEMSRTHAKGIGRDVHT